MVFKIGLFFEDIGDDSDSNLKANLEAISSEDKIPEVFYTLLEYAADNDKEKTFKLMLDYYYSIKFRVDNIFVNIARKKNLKYLKLMLANRKFDVNYSVFNFPESTHRDTAISVAADDPECLKVLLAEKDIELHPQFNVEDKHPLFVAIRSNSEECINLLINDDRLHESNSKRLTPLLISARNLNTFPDEELSETHPQWVYEQTINRLLYQSNHTKAQRNLNMMLGIDSILYRAFENCNLKLFKYILYANGWGTEEKDLTPGIFNPEFSGPNDSDNWKKSPDFFPNFFIMNNGLREEIKITGMCSAFNSQQINVGCLSLTTKIMLYHMINVTHIREIGPHTLIEILNPSSLITECVHNWNDTDRLSTTYGRIEGWHLTNRYGQTDKKRYFMANLLRKIMKELGLKTNRTWTFE